MQPPETPVGDILDSYFDQKETNFFRGDGVQGQLVFFTDRVGEDGTGHPLRCEITLIVKDHSGDSYPVAFRFYHAKDKWNLVAVIKCVSMRVMNTPPRVF
jgi:hypothetical protein